MRQRERAVLRTATGLVAWMLTIGPAQAQSPVSNWPNSPVRHPLRAAAPAATPSFSANLRGGFVKAGNTLLTCPTNSLTRRLRAKTRRQRLAAEPCIGSDNNGLDMKYVNVDPTGHFDSSTATLTLPGDARIVRAYLYWGADLARGVNNDASAGAPGGEDPNTDALWKTALLRTGTGAYTTVDATAPGRDGKWLGVPSWYSQPGNRPGFAYQVRADVTPEISRSLAATRRRTASGSKQVVATVANVQAGRGYNRHGGWTLLVAWESDTAAWRNLTLFDGFAFVQVQANQELVVGPLDFTGFQTPASGNVDAHATVWAYEGDRTITKDYLALGRLGTACPGLPHLSDAVNPVANFFNSTISANGATVGGRIPGFDNQLGFDLDTPAIKEGTIPNGANGASVCLGTTGDTYFFGGIAFDTLIRAPNAHIDKTVQPTTANPGDIVTYTSTVTNPQTTPTPTEGLTNVVTDDPLPSGLDFVDFTINPDNRCAFNTTTRVVHCDVGTLAPDGSFSYAYRARVSAAAQGTSPASLINAACYRANSEDQPNVLFYGCDNASIVVPPNPYVDLGVVKRVSAETISPGGTLTWTLVATNRGPGTSTGFVLADQLPAGVTFVSATADAPLACTTPALGANGSVVCTTPTVPAAPAAGSTLTVTITAGVPPTTANGTVLTNRATVNGDQPEPTPDPNPNRDSTQTRVVVDQPLPSPAPSDPEPNGPTAPPVPPSIAVLAERVANTRLSLHKHATTSRLSAGRTVTFRLRVANIAEAGALRVTVCDVLPRGMSLVSAPGFHHRGRALCTTMPRLTVGAARNFSVTAHVTRDAPPVMRNVATARASNATRVIAHATIGTPPARFTG
jgi:large repetitive protein